MNSAALTRGVILRHEGSRFNAAYVRGINEILRKLRMTPVLQRAVVTVIDFIERRVELGEVETELIPYGD